jgi:hypothetical protein
MTPEAAAGPGPLLDPERPYCLFNREERHLAGVLFHLLCLGGNAKRLCSRLRPDWPARDDELGVYLEYSYLRDVWGAIGRGGPEANTRKRKILRTMLADFGGRPELLAALDQPTEVREFNHLFVRHPSKTDVQSPATWQLGTFGADGSGFAPEDLLALCKLKWAFRAKPDVVVQPSLGRAICLELKLESGEAAYPAAGAKIRLLRERGLYDKRLAGTPLPMRQTALQRLAMEHLFGTGNVEMVFVTRRGSGGVEPGPSSGEEPLSLSWGSLLGLLEVPAGLPRFVQAAIDLCSVPAEVRPIRGRGRRPPLADRSISASAGDVLTASLDEPDEAK